MNRHRTKLAVRSFAAFAVIAVLLASSPAAWARPCVPQSCGHACCQTQPMDYGCCDSEPSHECPAIASRETTVWLPPRTSDADPAIGVLDRSDFSRIGRKSESKALHQPVSSVCPSSLITWHLRLQI